METSLLMMPEIEPSFKRDSAMERVARMNSHLAKTGKMDKAADQNSTAIKQAAQEFEAMFLAQMLEHMFDGVETNELFGGGFAEDIYRSMMIDEYGKILARSGGIGIADHVLRELQQVQEVKE